MTIIRPSTVWAIFAICITVLFAAMAWVTAHTLRLENARVSAEQDRELQERVRLALWRMDSAAGAIVIAENARPANHFRDFHSADQAYTANYQILQKGAVILPSPLLNNAPDHTQLYCQLGSDGKLTSPQVPIGNNRDLAEQNYVSRDEIESAAGLLNQAQKIFPDQSPNAKWPPPFIDGSVPQQPADWSTEQTKNSGELLSRSQSKDKSFAWSNNTQQQIKIRTKNEVVVQQAESAGIDVDGDDDVQPFEGIWRDGELFLVRDAMLDGRKVTQGIWLNAVSIGEMLLSEVRDLLPMATLSPLPKPTTQSGATASPVATQTRNLVSLPFRLEPGEIVMTTPTLSATVKRSLALAWSGAILATLAVGGLLYGIIGLSERRAAFVSAVTHELRTPLTTFRLYSEMLSLDMVQDSEKRREYLTTLSSEANRLSHLVENVLAYSRIEKGSARTQVEEVSLQSIIDRVLPRLAQRAEQSSMQIHVDVDSDSGSTRVNVDLTAVEQILFNLVDNACKYAEPDNDQDRIIRLEADIDAPMALLRVRDHGRGISKLEERRLFQPFEKSAHKAAHSAPGVGLGLALCRKLARALGGEVHLCRKQQGGCFVLALPVLSPVRPGQS